MMVISTAVGQFRVEEDGIGISRVELAGQEAMEQAARTPLMMEAERQIQAYLSGRLRRFDLPLSMQGSVFDRAVWAQLLEIPYGTVTTYGDIASALGNRRAARAVGASCGRNPLLLLVPCHRVVGASGKLTGFAAGLQTKRALLSLEGIPIKKDKVCLNKT